MTDYNLPEWVRELDETDYNAYINSIQRNQFLAEPEDDGWLGDDNYDDQPTEAEIAESEEWAKRYE